MVWDAMLELLFIFGVYEENAEQYQLHPKHGSTHSTDIPAKGM